MKTDAQTRPSRHELAAAFRDRLLGELEQLNHGLALIDPASDDPSDRWAASIYRKLIQRRRWYLERCPTPV